jgi:4-phytase/acid phosphatase
MSPIAPNIAAIPSAQRLKIISGLSLKGVLTGLLLAIAIESPVLAQTIKEVDDGTILKEIIVFGRHSIRSGVIDSKIQGKFSANPYPGFVGVPDGYLTPNGQKAARLLGSYFHDYLIHEGVLTGNTNTDLARSYFRANSIERSYMTAAKFGAGLIPGASIPVHSYPSGTPDPVFDPLSAMVATVDPARAVAEVLGVFGSGTNIASAYSGEFSLIGKVLYPAGTQPTNNAAQGSLDPTTLPITLTSIAPLSKPYSAGNVIDTGGLNSTLLAADPFVMQYADGFPAKDVGWGRLTMDALSQQTRLITLQIDIVMRQHYLAKVQSSSAASHILRSMNQAIGGEFLAGAFGTAQSQVHVIISSDFYVAGLAGLLGLHWLLPGYQPDYCAPGGALVFELRQVKTTGQYLVRAFYTAQTFDQLRYLTPLTLTQPPATMQLLIPRGSNSAGNLDIDFTTFSNLLNEAIGPEYVQPFEKETPPDVLNPYTAANNPTNIIASSSGKTLTISWPVDHLGWNLQAQTNGLSDGQWVDLPDTGDINSVAIPITQANLAVFYRLSRP